MKFSALHYSAVVAVLALGISSVTASLSARRLHCLINQEREHNLFDSFKHSKELTEVAMGRALTMANHHKASLAFPDEPSLADRTHKADANTTLHEFSQSAGVGATREEQIVSSIVNSAPTHELFANNWTHIGIGFARAREGVYWSLVYGRNETVPTHVYACSDFDDEPIPVVPNQARTNIK
ncbi:hypothetical protein SYNPS1DRAFT_25075 [Syncephalis pseudoplumigaleata]|uniref:SCP domain-containing protein n=1 Tax=Syncephalis pseudoplumigaleata TaxID=1712513 RepID=A0A4P9YUT5_9FUNG|nr:hypothetical protein SYNPS1DRAFT_25075 [Syncephalis pseudoplumigaleata]|eukprot:RKP22971.1 hypothetical protein SYNPS1DRAFT_25075 [Syncephalis pseudoplumigaleata]